MATNTLGDAADTASAAMRAAADQAGQAADRLREELSTFDKWIRDMVEEYPLACFFGAVATGYLLGRIARRM